MRLHWILDLQLPSTRFINPNCQATVLGGGFLFLFPQVDFQMPTDFFSFAELTRRVFVCRCKGVKVYSILTLYIV